MAPVLSTCRAGRWQIRLESVPPSAWLALQAAALWVHWHWVARRVVAGSDDPLGLVAFGVLVVLVVRLGPSLRAQPRLGWLAAALVASVAATASVFVVPPLAGALLAALALAAGLRAFLPSGRSIAPLAGLAVLSLPLVASLQFYAGYPLRVLTAQCSTWLLQAVGVAAERSGTVMEVHGRLVIVDAPCSGVQMVWMAYFCACALAAWHALPQRRFLRRLPAVGALVLAGNVLRNTVLVAFEARGPLAAAWHEAIGLAVLAAVCAGVAGLMRSVDDAAA
jgi:exosortase/archaeosortase family protein